MKKTLFSIVLFCASIAHAHGSEGVGGGDLCEDRIQIIRQDLREWINKGGPGELRLPYNFSAQNYSVEMIKQIDSAKIKCVGPGDAGFPVSVYGTPKICRFDQSQNLSQITCDYAKFMLLGESNQYLLTHHEYAGLAGVELPNRDDSAYEVSNQLSAFLIDEVVKKLAIHPQAQMMKCSDAWDKTLSIGTKCLTLKGFVYERVSRKYFGAAWKDQDGIMWSEKVGHTDYAQGIDTCKNLGSLLPTRADLERAQTSGIGELMSGSFIWTSSSSSSAGQAYSFYTSTGRFSSEPIYNENDIYCIAHP